MSSQRGAGLPVVAVVGRPNVGKSSLVNRVLGRRDAIVEATPGVTRDRRGFAAEWRGREFEIVDTGGLEPGADGLEERVAEQALVAIATADVIVLVVDAIAGPLEDDVAVAEVLRRSDKPVVIAANKVDDPRDEPLAAAFYRFGLGDPIGLSALHGRGSGDLLDEVVRALPAQAGDDVDSWGAVAIVGRPNVGKSSILNALINEDRSIVDARPGTTRDPVDSMMVLPDGRSLTVIDTAGMRRQVRVKDPIEYFSFLRTRRTLERCDVCLLVIDAGEGVTGHDQRLAERIVEEGRACVIALNKWDLKPRDSNDLKRFLDDISHKLRWLEWAPVIRTCAPTGRGIERIVPLLCNAIESHRRRLPTAEVNRILADAQQARPHPRTGGRAVRILYGAQPRVEPPSFVLFATGQLDVAYLRYLHHRIRAVEAFEGTPINIDVKLRSRQTARGGVR